ncbi:cupin domain-containing protein [Rubinisphaera brasiliensis]|uniref:Cupin 2 conserved barrel domain protein n=1 Tax=Rubinisphaera brasiliensis (strain ATCC 49424 / DSM 5305 / JCM 21570 / IAM 15109 / NBRC 103401 / IFAM 1448) TaxID=756272 RepID=F0SFR5_RUBBR|nr:cupin domain-containing protein [Rubinisphaera brasiliensis]ADY61522.1 Cupin 2 conserved barrel domain protein [Rubinisphaera brasiliensis DSM 5305]
MPNLFHNLPTNLPEELIEVLAQNEQVRIERIVSTGQRSDEGFWYDQDEHEWVIVLSGRARLAFPMEEPLELGPGDYVFLPAHRKHRVDWTAEDETTVWLAIFFR